MENKIIPISIITGYLGSGKTTLINHALSNAQGYKIAVIVNDIGEINIDAELIQKGGIVSSDENDLVSLSNGCICCTLKKDLIDQIMNLVNSNKFDHILIEASGICEPVPIAQSVYYIEQTLLQNYGFSPCKLDAVISVVDALRLSEEFACGKTLDKQKLPEDDLANIVINQIEFCDVLIINKCSLVEKEKLDQIRNILKALQPNAKVIETDYANVPLDSILDTNAFDINKAFTSAGWLQTFENDKQEIEEKHKKESEQKHKCSCGCHEHEHQSHCHEEEHDEHCTCGCHEHEHNHDEHCTCGCHEHEHKHDEHCNCGCHEHKHENGHSEGCTCHACRKENDNHSISTFVYYRRKPFDKQKFSEFAENQFDSTIIRTKGMLYFADELDNLYVFEQAGTQKVLNNAGTFVASLPEEEIAEYKKQPSFMEIWDEEYGDRLIKLVFIGQGMDKHKIIAELDKI